MIVFVDIFERATVVQVKSANFGGYLESGGCVDTIVPCALTFDCKKLTQLKLLCFIY